MIDDGTLAGRICGAQMRLNIKEAKCWSYQIRISERCYLGHIAHGESVIEEPESPDDDVSTNYGCW